MKAGELLGEHKKMKDRVKRLEKEVKHLEKHKNHHSLVSGSVCFVPCNEPDVKKKTRIKPERVTASLRPRPFQTAPGNLKNGGYTLKIQQMFSVSYDGEI